MISGVSPADIPVGLAAAMAATWVSLRLLPARASRLQFSALVGLTLKFLRQGVVSGTDVAWRALRPRLQLRPGFVACPLHLPPGGERSSSLKRRRRVPQSNLASSVALFDAAAALQQWTYRATRLQALSLFGECAVSS
jgi:hypothetical protein